MHQQHMLHFSGFNSSIKMFPVLVWVWSEAYIMNHINQKHLIRWLVCIVPSGPSMMSLIKTCHKITYQEPSRLLTGAVGVIMEVTKDIIDGPYCKLIPIVLKRYEKYMISNSKTKLFLYRSNLKIEKLFVKSFFYKL